MSGGPAREGPADSWFEPLAEPLEAPAFQFAVLLVEDSALAQDLVQEAFVRVWRSPRTPRDLAGFRRWLYKTIVNLARDHHRKQLLRNKLRLVLPRSVDPTEEFDRKLDETILRKAIKSLKWREREALYLRYFDDTPFEEVALTLGIRPPAARVLVHRALKKLRDRLSEGGLSAETST